MAATLWGKVYLHDVYAGRLQEEPGGRCTFTYDPSYLDSQKPRPLSYSLPLRPEPYVNERGLHPFFDNLVAEGWLKDAQARALGVAPEHRLALLLGFGHDLAGAVSVEDPEPPKRRALDQADKATAAALLGRASLSGIQRKLLVRQEGGTYRPVHQDELSTHIAKLASGDLPSLLELEFLSSEAVRALLPDDAVAQMKIVRLPAASEDALVITRFDRTRTGKRLHFEEFNQLLGRHSGADKYDGNYEDMGQFILSSPSCVPAEAYTLLRRIFACLLVGNTDAHFKNFAMFHTPDGLRLTPAYDLVAASYYDRFQTIALALGGARDVAIGSLQAKHLVKLAEGFEVSQGVVSSVVTELGQRLSRALAVLEASAVGSKGLRDKLQRRMEKRWKGSFASIGPLLSKRRRSAGGLKD
jgi:serine/threonine-protein kinase HipA